MELPLLRDLADAGRHFPVVDRVLDSIGEGVGRDVQPEIEEKRLRVRALFLLDPMPAVELQPVQLDRQRHASAARAAVKASTCSRTSCTRRIVAPRSYAATAAPMLAAVEPVVASGSPSSFPSELLREKPTT